MRVILLLAAFITTACGKMVGGWTVQNAEDPQFMDLAWQAMKGEGFNNPASNDGPNHVMPIKVISAKSKVVAGISYELELLVGESLCEKGAVAATELSASKCQLKENGRRTIHKLNIWEKPWENFRQFTVEKVRDVGPDEKI